MQMEYGHPNSYNTASGIGYSHGAGAYYPPIENHITDFTCENPVVGQTSNSPHLFLPNRLETQTDQLTHKRSISDSQPVTSKVFTHSPSESQLPNLSAKFKMTRSKELDDLTLKEEGCNDLIPVHESNCNHKLVQHSFSNASEKTSRKYKSDSTEEFSERRLSSPHSDDTFDFPLEETDV
ncbi:hypothetical protein FSP39_004330 [Pinctada imbricata]|uniref:Uncharacterized protein n=1 Tax=Pinctada imbricata TaxID=66713 RepID=A0AA88YCV6_PINIB|nr:hypothetical protein FSP39_004330 [Pinctada imbricata]